MSNPRSTEAQETMTRMSERLKKAKASLGALQAMIRRDKGEAGNEGKPAEKKRKREVSPPPADEDDGVLKMATTLRKEVNIEDLRMRVARDRQDWVPVEKSGQEVPRVSGDADQDGLAAPESHFECHRASPDPEDHTQSKLVSEQPEEHQHKIQLLQEENQRLRAELQDAHERERLIHHLLDHVRPEVRSAVYAGLNKENEKMASKK
ncbi:hypothetical protein BJ508DRAFT_361245 [Ascobolus immersus RN42]|uniref:Uncharacterized protein n=1 Tax=Ascobolus immersus RN42 TaxID=1160509 RepID=A0A3N4ICA4_ASCIM|nr:hypothetical protein BJ508DRAFT_361245 [Ascobolus immersus RN42]